MCGICGIAGDNGKSPETLATLKRMVQVMRHRGPDDEGFYCDDQVGFGHARLSIIDVETGCQPMSNEDESLWIVYNGEVYNYVELRDELLAKGHTFRTRSDTEVILHSYEEYGTQFVQHFNGMFAFALWDKPRKKLVLARDRVGIKPLYFVQEGDRFLFASEIKALLESRSCPREVDRASVAEYMERSYVAGRKTFLSGVRKLLPGHVLTLEGGALKESQYWDVTFAQEEDRGEAHYVERLAWLISDSLRLRLRSDVPLGAHLSGGIDSSTVVCTASKLLDERLKTFSGAFDEGPRYDERQHIRVVARACNTEHHEVVPTMEEFFGTISRLVWYLDEPVVGAGVFPQYVVSALAGKHVKVVLGGQGGDELFAGYTRYYRPYFADRVADCVRLRFDSGAPLTLVTDFLKFLVNRGSTDIPLFFRRLSAPSPEQVLSAELRQVAARLPSRSVPQGLGKFARMLYVDLKEYLQGLLHVEDRTSMAASIESRVPILDHRIVEMAASMPYKHKMRNGVTKYLLRRAAEGRVPASILARRDKMGFPTPIDVWFSRRGAALLNFFDSPDVERRGLLDRARAVEIVKQHVRGKRDHSPLIWRMLNVELWHSLFIEGKTTEEAAVFRDS
ncbi:MAG: asparagine synthase (glutamine-hydrolyzing) [Candidatus Eiseniibacteriota bacterium]|nr:MAG: asparagine synthase (glutamine-hydrolyzing) [Candidatus Eisenbacteria bacterium]